MNKNNIPKLLYVINSDWFLLSHRKEIVISAVNLGFDVYVASPSTGTSSIINNSGMKHINIQLERSGKNVFKDMIYIYNIAKIYFKLKPNIVHHITVKPIIYGAFVSRLTARRSCIYAISGMGMLFQDGNSLSPKIWSYMMRLLINKNLSHILVQNKKDEDKFKQYGFKNIKKFPGSGVNLNEYILPKSKHGENTVNVIYASRLLKTKGIYEYIEAIKLLKNNREQRVKYFVAGMLDTEQKNSITREEVTAWEEEKLIQYLGNVDDMPILLSKIDILVLPSYYKEGLPKVLIEAGAMGIPVITTNVPGCSDIIINKYNGFICEPRNPIQLKDKMEEMITNKKLREIMGNNARKRVEKLYDVRKVVSGHVSIYRSLSPCAKIDVASSREYDHAIFEINQG